LVLMALNAGAPRMLKPDWQLAVSEGDSESYFREFDRNVSPRARQFDLGVGLASISASLIALLAMTRSWSVQRVKALQTPRHRWLIFLLSNAAWIYYIWATTRHLILQAARDEFPPWADSIAIPIAGLGAFMVFGLVAINVGLAVYLHRASLPVPMWARPRAVRAWVLNAGVAVALLASAWTGYDAVRFGDALMPPAVVAVSYLLLVGRAAVCAASQSKAQDQFVP
jgi:hypothetical protein